MAEKLGILDQMLFGHWADRSAINRNADNLSAVEANVGELRKLIDRQDKEIAQLRAMFMGMVEVLHGKGALDEAELAHAVEAAWTKLNPPAPEKAQASTDPYRSTPTSGPEPTAAEIEAAKALLASAQNHHFSQRFTEARAVYQQIVEQYASTKQAATARQQLENLRRT